MQSRGGNPKQSLSTARTGRETGAWILGHLEGMRRLRIQFPVTHFWDVIEILLESGVVFQTEEVRNQMVIGTAIPFEFAESDSPVRSLPSPSPIIEYPKQQLPGQRSLE